MSPTKKTPAEQAAQRRYMAGKATIQLVMSPEEREAIKAAAADLGKSANAYIMDVVRKDIRSDKSPEAAGSPTRAGTGESSILSPEILQAAQEAAQAVGEEVPAFIHRAVAAQAKRDKVARLMRDDKNEIGEE